METTELKTVLDGIRTSVEGFTTKQTALQTQVDAIDKRISGGGLSFGSDRKALAVLLKENDAVARVIADKRGRATLVLTPETCPELFEQKTTVTSAAVGVSTSGVLQIDRMPRLVQEARQTLRVRDLLSSRPTDYQIVDFVKVNTPLSNASPQVEASSKFENTVTFSTVSERVRTIATFIRASRQVLDDFNELSGFLQTSLPFYVNQAEEVQLLSGDNVGENLHGIIPQATAFQMSLLSTSQGWTKIDMVGRAIQQIVTAKELPPTFLVCHPVDWWQMRLTKDSIGRYILGDPQTTVATTIFDLDVVPTVNISQGSFLVGNGTSIAAEIRDRMQLQVDISTEDADNFTKNLVTIRAEKRLALLCYRPACFISGSFSNSPA